MTTRNLRITDRASNRRKGAPAFSVELAPSELDAAMERLARALAAMKRGPYRRHTMQTRRPR
jgi:5,10-methylenetetrahydrofolate reductase